MEVVPTPFRERGTGSQRRVQARNNANAYIIQNHGILALERTSAALLGAEPSRKPPTYTAWLLSTGRPITTLPDQTRDMARSLREYEVSEARKKSSG